MHSCWSIFNFVLCVFVYSLKEFNSYFENGFEIKRKKIENKKRKEPHPYSAEAQLTLLPSRPSQPSRPPRERPSPSPSQSLTTYRMAASSSLPRVTELGTTTAGTKS
jgi:hypothetical protein